MPSDAFVPTQPTNPVQLSQQPPPTYSSSLAMSAAAPPKRGSASGAASTSSLIAPPPASSTRHRKASAARKGSVGSDQVSGSPVLSGASGSAAIKGSSPTQSTSQPADSLLDFGVLGGGASATTASIGSTNAYIQHSSSSGVNGDDFFTSIGSSPSTSNPSSVTAFPFGGASASGAEPVNIFDALSGGIPLHQPAQSPQQQQQQPSQQSNPFAAFDNDPFAAIATRPNKQ